MSTGVTGCHDVRMSRLMVASCNSRSFVFGVLMLCMELDILGFFDCCDVENPLLSSREADCLLHDETASQSKRSEHLCEQETFWERGLFT